MWDLHNHENIPEQSSGFTICSGNFVSLHANVECDTHLKIGICYQVYDTVQ